MKAASAKPKLNWKQKILRDLQRVEKLLPEPDFIQDDWPEWTRQMALEVGKVVFPGIGESALHDPTAHEIGRIVGAKRAGWSELDKVELSEKEMEVLERTLTKAWGEKAEEKFTEQLKFVDETFTPAYERAIVRAIGSASKQSGREQADFFKGYSHMVGEKPDVRVTTTTKIYFLMVLNWRIFEALAKSGHYSARQLHDLLCSIFGAHLVGSLKNTEKMCERKGLSFRKRGRPALPEKADTPSA